MQKASFSHLTCNPDYLSASCIIQTKCMFIAHDIKGNSVQHWSFAFSLLETQIQLRFFWQAFIFQLKCFISNLFSVEMSYICSWGKQRWNFVLFFCAQLYNLFFSWQQILNLFAFFFHGNCLVSADIRADNALCVFFLLPGFCVCVCRHAFINVIPQHSTRVHHKPEEKSLINI